MRSDDRTQAEQMCVRGTPGRKINIYEEQPSKVIGLTLAPHTVNTHLCFLHFYRKPKAEWLLLVLRYSNVQLSYAEQPTYRFH